MGELQSTLEAMFGAFERGETETVVAAVAKEAQGIDEISRQWMRTGDDVRSYLRQLSGMVSGVKTTIKDGHEIIDGDRGLLTCWMEQDYTADGQSQHIAAPTTVIFNREDGAWKFSLFHSIPLA